MTHRPAVCGKVTETSTCRLISAFGNVRSARISTKFYLSYIPVTNLPLCYGRTDECTCKRACVRVCARLARLTMRKARGALNRTQPNREWTPSIPATASTAATWGPTAEYASVLVSARRRSINHPDGAATRRM